MPLIYGSVYGRRPMKFSIKMPKRRPVSAVAAFDHMIEKGLYKCSCDPWCAAPGSENYCSVRLIKDQVQYRGETFVVSHKSGRTGSGGMDEGSPASATIIRIKAVP